MIVLFVSHTAWISSVIIYKQCDKINKWHQITQKYDQFVQLYEVMWGNFDNVLFDFIVNRNKIKFHINNHYL